MSATASNTHTSPDSNEALSLGSSSMLYQDANSLFSEPISRHSPNDDTDTEALAGFLLSLKHRSVTPEPKWDDSTPAHIISAKARQTTPPQSPHVMAHPLMGSPPSSTATAPASRAVSSPPTPQTPDPTRQVCEPHSSPLTDTIPLESLIAQSDLVCMDDRDLVPDALFAAMSLMQPCRLQHADRVGCYKNRELDFLGMCCRHCGGQPGFGRYFPNSVRSLAQTTTSQTILKHVGTKCRFTPPNIRNTILELQREHSVREGLPSTGRPRYGSRKIFFQRVWQRLHGENEEDTATTAADDVSTTKGGSAAVSVSSSSSSSSSASSVHSLEDDESRFYNCGGKRKETGPVSSSLSPLFGEDARPRRKRVKLNRSSDALVPTQVSTL